MLSLMRGVQLRDNDKINAMKILLKGMNKIFNQTNSSESESLIGRWREMMLS